MDSVPICSGNGEGGEEGGRQCRVHFRVRAEGCGFGRTVAISGSSAALGNFDVRQTLPLVTTPEAYPVWYTDSPVVVPAGEPLSYRYCILEGGQFNSYEEESNTPRIITPISTDTVVENIVRIASVDKTVTVETLSGEEEGGGAIVREVNPKQPDAADSNNGSAKSEDFGVQGSLYVVCYHLPLVIERTGTVPSFKVSWNDSIIARTDGAVANHVRMHWVGTPTVQGSPNTLTEAEKSELTAILLLMDCIPVYIDSEVKHASYQGFCKQVLWPVFHNVDQLDCQTSMWAGQSTEGSAETDDRKGAFVNSHTRWWEAYSKVNESIINVIMARLHPHDIVWVHDYHLMLVPGMLRPATHPSVRIIFYLHIPFPTSQVRHTLWNLKHYNIV
jgi:trehalose 6-phosphate synthase/phosphatase